MKNNLARKKIFLKVKMAGDDVEKSASQTPVWVWIIMGILAVVVIALIIFLIIQNNKHKQQLMAMKMPTAVTPQVVALPPK